MASKLSTSREDAKHREPSEDPGIADLLSDTEIRWPSYENHGLMIRSANRHFIRQLQERIADHGITVAQWRVLRILWADGEIPQAELAQNLAMDGPNVTTILDSLVEQGLVRRRRNRIDRRKMDVFLTTAGRDMRAVLVPHADSVNRIAADGISSADLRIFHKVLRRMMVSLINLSNVNPRTLNREVRRGK